MSILLGWWLVPALITAAWFLWVTLRKTDSGIGAGIDGLLFFAGLVPVLIAWLIWALLN